MVFLQYLMRIYSTLLVNQKFLKANMGFVANYVSNFIALFIVLITDGRFFLIFKILKRCQPFNDFPSILQIKTFNMAYQVLRDLSLPSSPASLSIPAPHLMLSASLDFQIPQYPNMR